MLAGLVSILICGHYERAALYLDANGSFAKWGISNLSPQQRVHPLLGGRAQAGCEPELTRPGQVEVHLEREEPRFQTGEDGGEAGGIGAKTMLCTEAVEN